MKYLLDTNVCVDYLNGRYPHVVERIHASSRGALALSSVAAAELRYGADRSGSPKRNHERLDVLMREIRCLPFDEEAAREYGRVRTRLEAKGQPIGPYDMQIAAHAIAHKLVLVTADLAEFARVQGLRCENWRT